MAYYDATPPAAPLGPPRERTCADHDAPWRYAPYHLRDIEKLRLWRRARRCLIEEFTRGPLDPTDFGSEGAGPSQA